MLKVLSDFEPFVVRGYELDTQIYAHTLALFQKAPLQLFNLLGKRGSTEKIRNFHELIEAFAELKINAAADLNVADFQAAYAQLFSKYLVNSQELDTTQAFSVQLDVQVPSPAYHQLVAPITRRYAGPLGQATPRLYLNTVLNISRGQKQQQEITRKIHGHNYDTFTILGKTGPQTRVYFFPPAFYKRFQTRLVTAIPGNVLLMPNEHALEESVMQEALVHPQVQDGDIVYTPPLWFHCFQHNPEYVNIANGEFFPELVNPRMGKIRPQDFGSDWPDIALHSEKLLQEAMRKPQARAPFI